MFPGGQWWGGGGGGGVRCHLYGCLLTLRHVCDEEVMGKASTWHRRCGQSVAAKGVWGGVSGVYKQLLSR